MMPIGSTMPEKAVIDKERTGSAMRTRSFV
jgi:hypothetical protein